MLKNLLKSIITIKCFSKLKFLISIYRKKLAKTALILLQVVSITEIDTILVYKNPLSQPDCFNVKIL